MRLPVTVIIQLLEPTITSALLPSNTTPILLAHPLFHTPTRQPTLLINVFPLEEQEHSLQHAIVLDGPQTVMPKLVASEVHLLTSTLPQLATLKEACGTNHMSILQIIQMPNPQSQPKELIEMDLQEETVPSLSLLPLLPFLLSLLPSSECDIKYFFSVFERTRLRF